MNFPDMANPSPTLWRQRNRALRVLYLDVAPNDVSQEMKLAGIRRYAGLRGWEVIVVPRADVERDGVETVLARCRPAGAIVEGSGKVDCHSLDAFGSLPVALMEYPRSIAKDKVPNVTIDDDAIADTAFRELSFGLPCLYAAVGNIKPTLWSRLRIDAFRRRCSKAGKRCRLFPSVADESEAARDARLAEWIGDLPGGTAVFVPGDKTAVSFTEAARKKLRHIPKELTLCSACNVDELSGNAATPVTSIQVDFNRMGWLAARALHEYASGGWRSSDPADLAVGPIFVVRRKSTAGQGRFESWIPKALELIRAKACEGLAIDELLPELVSRKGLPISRRNFDRRFREAMGHSVGEEILSVRIGAACELLAQTDTPITAIADFCGFGCHSALDAIFRSRFGMSMSKWRKRNAR